MPAKKTSAPRKDKSAISRLVHDFGLLLISEDFERYLDDRPLLNQALREGRAAEHVSLADQHMIRFIPLLEFLGIEDLGQNPQYQYFEEIERLMSIEALLRAFKLTVDFSLQTSELHKRLKRKFAGTPTALTLPYKTKKLISDELVKHCRDVMWIINEFHIERDDDSIEEAMWDINIWTVILDADRLHRETGRVHSAFLNYLADYQFSKGDGGPRSYLRTALTVLLAECFEDFDQKKRKPQIHDWSSGIDRNEYGIIRSNRVSNYDSGFADFLIEFLEITGIEAVPKKKDNSLDHYRKIARIRASMALPRISGHLKSSMVGREVSEIIDILDRLKF